MKALIRFLSILVVLSFSASVYGQGPGPRIFFSDLESGPNTGGQINKGAWVTIWGKGFGATRGKSVVTVGGGAADNYPLWADTAITFQLGLLAKTGAIVVHVAPPGKGSSAQSNGVPFTVRKGKIFFVSAKGSDWHRGSPTSPWKTIVHAKDDMSAGDITYIQDGVKQISEDNFNAYLSMDTRGDGNSGKPGAPKALVAYPGATATVGVARGLAYGIRTPNIRAREDYWVISQLHIFGGTQAMDVSGTGWRVVGNDIQCPGADSDVGCFQMSQSSQIKFYGNEVHNAGINPTSSKYYHAVYFSTDSNHIDVGWNHIHDNYTCRAIQFHSSPLCSPSCGSRDQTGFNQFDLHVHDNLIHGTNCNGINFATVDPSKGPVEAYNNVIYHVGVRDPQQEGGAFACIYVAGITNHGPPGNGTVEVFNNTVFDCAPNTSLNTYGSRGAFSFGSDSTALFMRLTNNIVYQLPGEIYLDGHKEQINGDTNLWFGLGDGPWPTANNINADPQFVNLGSFDFHLTTGSPASGSGLPVLPANRYVPIPAPNQATDKDGLSRPQGKAFGLGAYEVPLGSNGQGQASARPN